jgi:hypothetical protein
VKPDPFAREILLFKRSQESGRPIACGRELSRAEAAAYVIGIKPKTGVKTKKWREIYFDQFLEFLQHSGYLGILGERWLVTLWSKAPIFTELFCQLLKELYPLWKTHKKSEAGKKSRKSKKTACNEQPPQAFPIDLSPYLPRGRSSRLTIWKLPPDS